MKVIKNLFLTILFCCGLYTESITQLNQPDRIQIGMSGGFGGLHEWGKPTFDIRWKGTTLRLGPGLFYLSAGITQRIAYYRPKKRMDRPIILSFYYHNDYFLSSILNKGLKKDINAFMLMPGMHIDLNHRGTIFLEISGGIMYVHSRDLSSDSQFILKKNKFLPMGEIRFGGIFLSRKEHKQKEPKHKKPKVKKIISKKLK